MQHDGGQILGLPGDETLYCFAGGAMARAAARAGLAGPSRARGSHAMTMTVMQSQVHPERRPIPTSLKLCPRSIICDA